MEYLFFSKDKQKNLSGGGAGAGGGGGGESRLYKLPTLRVRFGFCLFVCLGVCFILKLKI